METEERTLRLAKPVKKGIGHLLFSRFGLIALLLVVQIVLFCLFIYISLKQAPELMVILWVFPDLRQDPGHIFSSRRVQASGDA